MTNSEKQEKQVFTVMDPDGNEVTIEDFSPYDDQPGYTNDNHNSNGKTRKLATKGQKRPTPSDNVQAIDANDTGNAEYMKELYGDELIYCPSYGWMDYIGTHWQAVSDAKAYRLATATLRKRCHIALKQNNIDLVRASIPTRDKIAACVSLYQRLAMVEDASIFDNEPDLLNCLNGVVNLRTGSIEQHKPCQHFTYCIPVEYKTDADMSLWNDFVHGAVGNEKMAHFIQRAVGYSFTGHISEEKFFYLYGPPRAGKGTFTETLLALLPSPFGVEVDFNTFTASRDHDTQNFDLAPLKPSRFVVASESNRYQSLNPAKIKQFTGGNLIWCAFKHRDHFSYKPQYKIWLVSNHPMNADPSDDGTWVRPFIIEFPRSHVGSENTSLKKNLRSNESLEGVLRWVVEGAMSYYREGGLEPPKEVIEAVQRQRDEQDYVKQWLEDSPCLRNKDGEISRHIFTGNKGNDGIWESAADLAKSCKDWCIENNLKPVHPHQFASSLKRFGYVPKRGGHAGIRGYQKVEIQISSSTADTTTTTTADADAADSNSMVSSWERQSGNSEDLLSTVSASALDQEYSDNDELNKDDLVMPACPKCKSNEYVALLKTGMYSCVTCHYQFQCVTV